MDIKELKRQLEGIIGSSLSLLEMDQEIWNSLANDISLDQPSSGMARLHDQPRWLWKTDSSKVYVFEAETPLTEREIRLIDLLLSAAREKSNHHPFPSKRDEESRCIELGKWLQEQIKSGNIQSTVPDDMAIKPKLKENLFPFLLGCEDRPGQEVQYSKLNKLLRSYFGGEVVLVPMTESWLVLVREALLLDVQDESNEGIETERDMLGALCQGLYELIANEWGGGGFRLTVGDKLINHERLVPATIALQETLLLGRIFQVSEHIYLPWDLELERLVYHIPNDRRQQFIEESGVDSHLLEDEETLITLETFFQLDCNVSETAKRLYIHRNTLLYRLDKFKQETGLDVRSFQDAVLVKLRILLYKVTKRL
ncbi:helix-turn-helix domain-containing protein [Paenibacillus motobuensis]|uniref:PucR family transcriptional regulator n=1 Tax=Paenibacillus TaxID=44249 RepID=UPI00203FAD3E|nr:MULTISPECIES: PucR family transcriptional regulator [Paenibacillus]MCM3041376.1 helix-turn-helix domain-containing protein [Paenibacillus lutimineralis]MCM3648480.1 helix-turn-helix domain-containing protein [Paenibacillus motobuensis]